MNKNNQIYGVDISKGVFDVVNSTGEHFQFKNNVSGFVKRFIQMKLSKIKTDKSDAKAICEYASTNEVPLYTARDKSQAEALQILRLIAIYTKQSTALKNKLQSPD